MTLNDALAGLRRGYLPADASAEQLHGLARDFDRWGLAPEAEVARLRSREATIRQLMSQARAGRPGSPRSNRGSADR